MDGAQHTVLETTLLTRSYLIYAFVASRTDLNPALIAGFIRGVSGG
jgi:hypothetical protein